MTTEEAKAFVRRHFEDFVNRQDLSAADRNFASDYQEHGADAPPGSVPGPEGPKQYLVAAFQRFPNIHVTIEDIIAEGDKVVVRNVWRATDRDSQQQIEFGGIVIWRIASGKLAERWLTWTAHTLCMVHSAILGAHVVIKSAPWLTGNPLY